MQRLGKSLLLEKLFRFFIPTVSLIDCKSDIDFDSWHKLSPGRRSRATGVPGLRELVFFCLSSRLGCGEKKLPLLLSLLGLSRGPSCMVCSVDVFVSMDEFRSDNRAVFALRMIGLEGNDRAAAIVL